MVLALPHPARCPRCKGKGSVVLFMRGRVRCKYCKGSGRWKACYICEGKGEFWDEIVGEVTKCSICENGYRPVDAPELK